MKKISDRVSVVSSKLCKWFQLQFGSFTVKIVENKALTITYHVFDQEVLVEFQVVQAPADAVW